MEYDLSKLTPDIRYLDDMRTVLFDKNWSKTAQNTEMYYMYRGLDQKGEIRYDITVIPPKMIGSEFTKTKGHYHVGAYGEIYTVLEGSAIFVMQKKKNDGGDEVEDIYAVKAEKGDVTIIPSFYGHLTINPSETQELKMANWVSANNKSDYSLFEKFGGACYYYILHSNSGQAGWIKNKNYKSVPELRFEEPVKSIPKDLNFLDQG